MNDFIHPSVHERAEAALAHKANHTTLLHMRSVWQEWAVSRMVEHREIVDRRAKLPGWRWLADRVLMRRQERCIAHARRHLANISTVEQVTKLLPDW
jgi:hypothetical protein